MVFAFYSLSVKSSIFEKIQVGVRRILFTCLKPKKRSRRNHRASLDPQTEIIKTSLLNTSFQKEYHSWTQLCYDVFFFQILLSINLFVASSYWYCWWKKSCTTWHAWNTANNEDTISTGFLNHQHYYDGALRLVTTFTRTWQEIWMKSLVDPQVAGPLRSHPWRRDGSAYLATTQKIATS